MKKRVTKQVRVWERWYKWAQVESERTGKTMSRLADEAFSMLAGEYKSQNHKTEALIKALFPDRPNKRDGQNASKTPSISELSTILRDTRSGEFWTSSKYLPDNDNETKV